MLVWLDGRLERARPAAGELRPRADGAVHDGRRHVPGDRRLCRRAGVHRLEPGAAGQRATTRSAYVAGQHDTDAKEFSFPIYANGSRMIPARGRRAGHAGRPRSDRRGGAPSGDRPAARAQAVRLLHERDRRAGRRRCSRTVARIYYDSGFEIKPMVRRLLTSPQFHDDRNFYKRYSWPVGVRRPVAEGSRLERLLAGQCADAARQHGPAALRAAGRQRLGARRGWFSTGGMLARMNFAAQLATNQKFNLRDLARPVAKTPEGAAVVRARPADAQRLRDRRRTTRCSTTPAPGVTWTGSDDQLATKTVGPRAPGGRIGRLPARVVEEDRR